MAKIVRRKGIVDTRALDVSIDEEGNVVSQNEMGGSSSGIVELPEMPEPLSEPPKYETEHKEEGREAIEPDTGSEKEERFEQPELKTPTANVPAVIIPDIDIGGSETSQKTESKKTRQYAGSTEEPKKSTTEKETKKPRGPIRWFEEEVLDIKNKDTGPYSETTDRLAALGGYSRKTWRTIQEEKQTISDDYNAASFKARSYKEEMDEIKSKRDRLYEEYRRAKVADDKLKVNKIIDDLNDVNSDYDRVRASYNSSRNEQEKLKAEAQDILREQSKYGFAVAKGTELDKREHHWRKEWAKPIAENTANMLTRPVIGNVTDVVGYGGMTGKTATAGLNELVGGYKTAAGANEWTRTRVGDRQLVEALVNVKPSGMITPFGTSGTVAGGNLSQQFEYNTPLRRIAVGDVTARPGYRLNIEDIHRKKKGTAPKLSRKKMIIKKKIATKRASVNSGMSGIVSVMSKINAIKMPGNKTTMTFVKTMDGIGKSGIHTIKNTGLRTQGNVSSIKKVSSEAHPLTLNIGAVGVVTPKIVEINLNRQTVGSKRKKLVKV